MSLACYECRCVGSFHTLIIFHKDGKFDPDKLVSSYPNFYTDCASFQDFAEVSVSRFAIVREGQSQSQWNTGTDGDTLGQTRYKLIDETLLAQKLPRIYAELIRWGTYVRPTSKKRSAKE